MPTQPGSLFPLLETERLQLRKLQVSDADKIFILRSDITHNQYLDRPLASSIDDAIAFINKIDGIVEKGDGYFWAIALKNEQDLAGTIGLWNIDHINAKAELGYELLPSYQHKGIMQEALAIVLTFAFTEMRLSLLEAWTHPGNKRSSALLEKFKFQRDPGAEAVKPADAPEYIYSLTATNYLVK
jgi:ribosomal-protein-alanine N-acetyltransferase